MSTHPTHALALFDAYPALAQKLAHLPLAELPTPVQPMPSLGAALGHDALYVKRDDLSGEIYGGNKVRKLEWLLAEARARDSRAVLTFGTAGSNHCLATALYARSLGLDAISILSPQANAWTVGRNLKMGYHAGAELYYYESESAAERGAGWQTAKRLIRDEPPPHVIRRGGSSALGTVGFVNAGLELAAQVAAGEMPRPDLLYVALGTMGTAAGLALGLAAAGLDTRVVAVRVVHPRYGNEADFRLLFDKTAAMLHRLDDSFPRLTADDASYEIRHDQFGEKYAVYTPAGLEAVELVGRHEGLALEGTYTGKAMAALVADARDGRLGDRTVLFWNTYNSRPFPEQAMQVNYLHLPMALHGYFEEPFQPLDPHAGEHSPA